MGSMSIGLIKKVGVSTLAGKAVIATQVA